jgi:adenylylsulfate kinase-like enzyme
MVIWVIGLSGAGKSTLARDVVGRARRSDVPVVLVDGDVIRDVFGGDLGHSVEDRRANARRIAKLCRFLDGEGVNVVCAILSIAEEDRAWMRAHASRYYEVFVDTPLEDLQSRDTKGLYAAARRGELPDVVGIDIAFETPRTPDLVIDNSEGVGELMGPASFLADLLSG